jgi:NTP pyrophosphatase (non-canonical NTP hydrolase)
MTDTMISPRLSNIIKAHVGHCPKGRKSRLRFLALALAGEAGELANNVKKEWRGDDRTPEAVVARNTKIDGEIVDVANYAFILARARGIDLGPAMLAKFEEVDKRPGFHNYGSGK